MERIPGRINKGFARSSSSERFRDGRDWPVVARPKEEFWWHSCPLPDRTRIQSKHKDQDIQFDKLDAIEIGLQEGFEDKNVLDIGAADGFFSVAASDAGAKLVDSLDLNYKNWPENIRFLANAWNAPVNIIRADFRTCEFTRRYDVILFLGVLYHLEDPLKAMQILHQNLVPGGKLVIETQMAAEEGDRPKFELASDVFQAIAKQGVESMGSAGVSNYFFPNSAAMQQLAHMYRYKPNGPIQCAYTRKYPKRAVFVFEHLEEGMQRWEP